MIYETNMATGPGVMNSIAEGGENKKQLDWLSERGCDEYQGYFNSKSLAADAVLALLLEHR